MGRERSLRDVTGQLHAVLIEGDAPRDVEDPDARHSFLNGAEIGPNRSTP